MPIKKQWITPFWFDEEIKNLPKDTSKENEKFITNDFKKKLILPNKSTLSESQPGTLNVHNIHACDEKPT